MYTLCSWSFTLDKPMKVTSQLNCNFSLFSHIETLNTGPPRCDCILLRKFSYVFATIKGLRQKPHSQPARLFIQSTYDRQICRSPKQFILCKRKNILIIYLSISLFFFLAFHIVVIYLTTSNLTGTHCILMPSSSLISHWLAVFHLLPILIRKF